MQAMVPYKDTFLADGQEAVKRGHVPEARLDLAVDRVLTLKHRLGLLPPGPEENAAGGSPQKRPREGSAAEASGGAAAMEVDDQSGEPARCDAVSQQEEEAQSLAAATEGIVLLKNPPASNALPLGRCASQNGSPSAEGDAEGEWRVEGRVAVVGPTACSAANLLDGWSLHWQGPDNEAEARCAHLPCLLALVSLVVRRARSMRTISVCGR